MSRLAGDQVIHGILETRVRADDRRRFAAEFERDRRQMLGGTARITSWPIFVDPVEQQMIEGLRAERRGKRGIAGVTTAT